MGLEESSFGKSYDVQRFTRKLERQSTTNNIFGFDFSFQDTDQTTIHSLASPWAFIHTPSLLSNTTLFCLGADINGSAINGNESSEVVVGAAHGLTRTIRQTWSAMHFFLARHCLPIVALKIKERNGAAGKADEGVSGAQNKGEDANNKATRTAAGLHVGPPLSRLACRKS